MLSLKVENRAKMSPLLLLFKVLAIALRWEKEIKTLQIKKVEIKFFVCR